jgi:hypothetical protein
MPGGHRRLTRQARDSVVIDALGADQVADHLAATAQRLRLAADGPHGLAQLLEVTSMRSPGLIVNRLPLAVEAAGDDLRALEGADGLALGRGGEGQPRSEVGAAHLGEAPRTSVRRVLPSLRVGVTTMRTTRA